MDADRFDSLLRTLSTAPSRRNALRFLAGSALGALLGLDQLQTGAKKGNGKGGGKGKGKGGGKGKGKNKKCTDKGKTIICHNGQTIEVSNCALKAHQDHGDTIGACTTPPPQPFCTGKNNCVGTGLVTCDVAGTSCFCWVTTEGENFCGKGIGADGAPTACGAACDAAGGTCINGAGGDCAFTTACSLPCPDPR